MSDRPAGADKREEIQIGGQAVIEGVVMRGPRRWALAVRRPCGDIHVEVNPTDTLAQRYPRLNHFPLRGVLALCDSLIIGIKSLTISANISLEEEPEGEEPEAGAEPDGEAATAEASPALSSVHLAVALTISVVLFLGIFIVLPAVIVRYLQDYLTNNIVYNLVEGGMRIAIFVLYLAAIGFLPDVRRLFQYHGAEHKAVHAYEAGDALTPEEVRRFSTSHMRCGTTFIVIVFVICVIVYSLMGRPPLWLRILERVAVIPVVAAISYEIIRFAGRHEDSLAVRTVMAPGLLFQRLTTRQPDDAQVEVAITSLEAAIGDAPRAAVP